MSYNPGFFTDILNSLLDIYQALEGFAQYVFQFLSLRVISVFEIIGLPAPEGFPEVTMLEVLFGASISVIFIGIIWKWFKEYIL